MGNSMGKLGEPKGGPLVWSKPLGLFGGDKNESVLGGNFSGFCSVKFVVLAAFQGTRCRGNGWKKALLYHDHVCVFVLLRLHTMLTDWNLFTGWGRKCEPFSRLIWSYLLHVGFTHTQPSSTDDLLGCRRGDDDAP